MLKKIRMYGEEKSEVFSIQRIKEGNSLLCAEICLFAPEYFLKI